MSLKINFASGSVHSNTDFPAPAAARNRGLSVLSLISATINAVERSEAAVQPAPDPAWENLKDDELLTWRICDLGVRIEGSELETRINQLNDELTARGLA